MVVFFVNPFNAIWIYTSNTMFDAIVDSGSAAFACLTLAAAVVQLTALGVRRGIHCISQFRDQI